jgi:soluble lytic murein transglycosylase
MGLPRRAALSLLFVLLAAAPARAQDAIAAIRADRWAEARAMAAQYADPVAGKLVEYYRMLAPGAAGPAEIAAFMAANPDWPNQKLLERRREEALASEPDGPGVLDQCIAMPVHAAPALLRCATAFSAAGQPDPAAAAIREAWRTGITDPVAEAEFLRRHGAIVRPEDEWTRFDHLAWGNPDAARRQASRLNAGARPAAEARLALRRGDPSAPALLASLPVAARSEPALVLDYARWLRRAGRDQDALALWKDRGEAAESAAPSAHLAEFWAERNLLARRLLSAGDANGAYALAAMPGQTAPETVADSAFLAGFIALRRLNEPISALRHFRILAAVSKAAISRARAHYWLGRARAASGEDPRAEYDAGSALPLTFYGQLAAFALGESPQALAARIRTLKDPGWARDQVLDFASRDLVRAAALLVAWGEPRRASAFLLRIDELTPVTTDRSMAARLALGLGIPDAAVAIARRMGRDGLSLPDAGWPRPVNPPEAPVDPALTLALIRQESSFDGGAASPAGARGLMQLLPATAQIIAQRIGEQTSVIALTTDARHNMRLGTAYLRSLLDQFGGSLPLALAAYNAGPNRVTDWLGVNGDPRTGQTDLLDWIELIPFGETRNYVQRVLENLVIYRAKSGQAGSALIAQWER